MLSFFSNLGINFAVIEDHCALVTHLLHKFLQICLRHLAIQKNAIPTIPISYLMVHKWLLGLLLFLTRLHARNLIEGPFCFSNDTTLPYALPFVPSRAGRKSDICSCCLFLFQPIILWLCNSFFWTRNTWETIGRKLSFEVWFDQLGIYQLFILSVNFRTILLEHRPTFTQNFVFPYKILLKRKLDSLLS